MTRNHTQVASLRVCGTPLNIWRRRTHQGEPAADGVPQGVDGGRGLLEGEVLQEGALLLLDVQTPCLRHRGRHHRLTEQETVRR